MIVFIGLRNSHISVRQNLHAGLFPQIRHHVFPLALGDLHLQLLADVILNLVVEGRLTCIFALHESKDVKAGGQLDDRPDFTRLATVAGLRIGLTLLVSLELAFRAGTGQDGGADLRARTAPPWEMALRRRLGAGTFGATYRQLSSNAAGFATTSGAGDFNGDHHPDLVTRTTDGRLLLMPWSQGRLVATMRRCLRRPPR